MGMLAKCPRCGGWGVEYFDHPDARLTFRCDGACGRFKAVRPVTPAGPITWEPIED